jgi:hypothetical protein
MSHDGARAAKAATKLLPLCSDGLGEVDDAGKHVSRRMTLAGRPPAKIVYGHVKYHRKLPRTVVVHQTADRCGVDLRVHHHVRQPTPGTCKPSAFCLRFGRTIVRACRLRKQRAHDREDLPARTTLAAVTRCSGPSPTFSDLLGRSVRQVDDAQKNVRWRATLAGSPPAQILNLHVKDARKVGVAVVGNHRSDGLRVQLSVDRHANSVRKRYAFAADATGLPAADVVRSGGRSESVSARAETSLARIRTKFGLGN